MPQLKITDYFGEKWVYESPKQKITRIIKELKSGSYKDTSIRIESSEYNDDPYKDSVEDSDVVLLCEALKNNPHVKEIVFYLQKVGNEGAKALAEIDTLEDVFISFGELGVEGGCALAKSKLKFLGIERCYIFYDDRKEEDVEDAEDFIASLINNKTIKGLRLTNTYIDDDLLVKLIENTKTIEFLYLGKIDFNEELFKGLNISQEKMHISDCREDNMVLLGEEIQESNT
jgi:hypothetical protein